MFIAPPVDLALLLTNDDYIINILLILLGYNSLLAVERFSRDNSLINTFRMAGSIFLTI